jgi:carbon-monoxide dehydrogenase medium subunit
VKPAPFRYRRPETLDAALADLADHGPGARVLAGGQSLVPLMNQRRERPAVLVDITRLPGLDTVEGYGRLRVGALVTQTAFERVPDLAGRCPVAHECLPFTGHLATRNRGTVGGSIAHADPRAELPLALLVLGGTAEVVSAGGRRTIAADDLFIGPYENALRPDEILVATEWPTTRDLAGQAFEEVAQRHGDYTIASAAVALRVQDGVVVTARVGVGAVGDRPLLLPAAAEALTGAAVDDGVAAAAGRVAADAIADPLEDIHGSAAYRRHLAGVLVARTALRAWEGAA